MQYIYLLWFLALIAVIVVIWAWFTIMTAEGDEEKTKAGKKRIYCTVLCEF